LKPVRSRRQAREAAVRALYELEIGGGKPDEVLAITLEEAGLSAENAAYAETLVRGYRRNASTLDHTIAQALIDYDFTRLAAVDRNLLRVATYELLHEPEIPPAVTIDEAVMIAKRYSTAESSKFVNGVLGRLLRESAKATWTRPAEPTQPEEEPEPQEPEIEVEEVEESELPRVGLWKIRGD
jgi:N utilization substance protein B